VKLISAVQKAGESGHFVRTISLRCYKILMQLFMLLYSERNATVHPCETFSMFPLWSVGEGTDFENEFFLKNLMCDFWSFSPRRGNPFNRCQWNLARRKGLKVSLNWPNLVLLRQYLGIYGPHQYLEKQPEYGNVDDTSLRINARPVMRWLLANAYLFLVGQLFANESGVLHFNALAGVISCQYRHKWYIAEN